VTNIVWPAGQLQHGDHSQNMFPGLPVAPAWNFFIMFCNPATPPASNQPRHITLHTTVFHAHLHAPVASVDTWRHLLSANRQLLAVTCFRFNSYGRRACSVAGSMVWNSLPDFIWDLTINTYCFRSLLETYLFTCY